MKLIIFIACSLSNRQSTYLHTIDTYIPDFISPWNKWMRNDSIGVRFLQVQLIAPVQKKRETETG